MKKILLLSVLIVIVTPVITTALDVKSFADGNEIEEMELVNNEDLWVSCSTAVVFRWNITNMTMDFFNMGADVHTMKSDTEGNLYVGTESSLMKYNGDSWSEIYDNEGHSLESVNEVFISSAGNIWIAHGYSYKGVTAKIYNNVFENVGTEDELIYFPMCEDSNGDIWARNDTSLIKYDGESWVTYKNNEWNYMPDIVEMIVDDNMKVWFGYWGGISHFDGTEWYTDSLNYGEGHENQIGVESIAISNSGEIYLGTYRDGILKSAPEGFIEYSKTDDGFPANYVYGIAIDQNNNIYAGTDNGLAVYKGTSWKVYSTPGPLGGEELEVVDKSPDGSLWFYSNKGISNFDGNNWNLFGSFDGEAVYGMSCFLLDSKGRVWAAPYIPWNDPKGIYLYESGNWNSISTEDGLGGNSVYDIAESADGGIWCVTNSGVSQYDGTSWTNYTFINDNVYGVIVSESQKVYCYSSQNIYVFSNENFELLPDDNGQLGEYTYINNIIIDNDENLWAHTDQGLLKYENSGWIDVISDDMLDYDLDETNPYFDSNGNLWAVFITGYTPVNEWESIAHKGLFKFNGTNWTEYNVENGLASENVTHVTGDGNGNIWVAYGTWDTYMFEEIPDYGISKYDGAEWTHYNTSDGLPTGNIYYINIDPNGDLWLDSPGMVSWVKMSANNGTGGTPVSAQCDFNDDGNINIVDVISLLLFQRSEPSNTKGDFNGDGNINISDAISLLLAQRNGTCSDISVNLSSTDENDYLHVNCPITFEKNDIEYLQNLMPKLNLSTDEESAYIAAIYGTSDNSLLPKSYSLDQNVPNPFNPSTTIKYSIPEGINVHVILNIYDIRGKLVNTLVDEIKESGVYSVFWDGKESKGRYVASGVYFFRIEAGNFVQTRKMVLLK